ncbi:hypothetical protein E2C01_082526 [Portunus trituberculatus]|uniref:Uncharacterized protein n=1 Tax=Portunus trituberculatus TaxID=210409 RepID=A0A5B7J565_PORTR|nr:hypothetical protein [Portunus trituberculatus]
MFREATVILAPFTTITTTTTLCCLLLSTVYPTVLQSSSTNQPTNRENKATISQHSGCFDVVHYHSLNAQQETVMLTKSITFNIRVHLLITHSPV